MKKDFVIRNIFEKFTRFINFMYKQAKEGRESCFTGKMR